MCVRVCVCVCVCECVSVSMIHPHYHTNVPLCYCCHCYIEYTCDSQPLPLTHSLTLSLHLQIEELEECARRSDANFHNFVGGDAKAYRLLNQNSRIDAENLTKEIISMDFKVIFFIFHAF